MHVCINYVSHSFLANIEHPIKISFYRHRIKGARGYHGGLLCERETLKHTYAFEALRHEPGYVRNAKPVSKSLALHLKVWQFWTEITSPEGPWIARGRFSSEAAQNWAWWSVCIMLPVGVSASWWSLCNIATGRMDGCLGFYMLYIGCWEGEFWNTSWGTVL